MAYEQFKAGDEVTIEHRDFGGLYTYQHTTVARLAGRAVVLTDGSRWTHRGNRWGENDSWSRGDSLYPRQEGLEREESGRVERERVRVARHWDHGVRDLDRLRLPAQRDEADAQLTGLLEWVRGLPREGA